MAKLKTMDALTTAQDAADKVKRKLHEEDGVLRDLFRAVGASVEDMAVHGKDMWRVSDVNDQYAALVALGERHGRKLFYDFTDQKRQNLYNDVAAALAEIVIAKTKTAIEEQASEALQGVRNQWRDEVSTMHSILTRAEELLKGAGVRGNALKVIRDSIPKTLEQALGAGGRGKE